MSKLQKTRAMSITRKLGLFTASAILGIVALTALFLVSEWKLILEGRKNNVRQVLEAAHDLLTYYHELGSKGTLTEPQALHAIMGLRCSGTEYFWINDMQPRMLMHPISRALMESKDLTDLKDATGNPFLQKW